MNVLTDDLCQRAALPPRETYCREMLEPWIIKSSPLDGELAKGIIEKISLKYRRKKLSRMIRSAARLEGLLPAFRMPAFVRSEYERIWSEYDWPRIDSPLGRKEPTYAVWKNEFLLLRKGGLNQMELDRICSVIQGLNPESVLEVGCGAGRNLLSLSVMYPRISFAGYELSSSGVALARSVQNEPRIPDVIARFCPRPVVDPTAHTKAAFHQGNAERLPLADKSVDVVFTRLALEQMDPIKDHVLSEIARIARFAVILVEPFNDSNRTPLQQLAKRVDNHFFMRVAELNNYNLRPMIYFDNWPHKIKEGVGLTVAKPV